MKVGIQNKEDRLILVWFDGKRRTMAIGAADNTASRAAARRKKAEIEQDWITGHYDPTLLKYKPRILGKSATEISVPELFDRFTKYHAKEEGLSQSSLAKPTGGNRDSVHCTEEDAGESSRCPS